MRGKRVRSSCENHSRFFRGAQKRGISAIVATVLIILITVASVTIVWVAVIPMIKTNLEMGTACLDADVIIDSSSGYTCYDAEKKILAVQIKKGPNEVDIAEVELLLGSGGTSSKVSMPFDLKSNAGKVFYIIADDVDEVSIAPIIQIGNSEKTCDVTARVNLKSCSLGEEVLKLIVNGPIVYRTDDDEMEGSAYGDGGDDGANKWIDLEFVGESNTYSLWIYGQAKACDSNAGDNYKLRVNGIADQTIEFNWCDMFELDSSGGTSGFEWQEFEIPGEWLEEGENQFNFWNTDNHYQDNWAIGLDDDNDFGMSAWSSNANVPSCRSATTSTINPSRDSYNCNNELMIYLTT